MDRQDIIVVPMLTPSKKVLWISEIVKISSCHRLKPVSLTRHAILQETL